MELCGAWTTDFFIGKEHICGFPAYLAGAKQRCEDHRCKRREPWEECGFQWSDDEKKDDFTDGQRLASKVELGERISWKSSGDA